MTTFDQIGPHLNAYEFSFNENLLADVRHAYQATILPYLLAPEDDQLLEGGLHRTAQIGSGDEQYYLSTYGVEPLLWISNDNWQTYGMFKDVFDALDIKDEIKNLVDWEKDITFYCGFFVVGNKTVKPEWHLDYAPGANAYTMITPLFPTTADQGDLLYEDHNQKIQKYEYQMGKAVIFGDHFPHVTEVYQPTEDFRVLLSMTCGSDKLDYWPNLKQTVGGQSRFFVLPCGHQFNSCECLIR